jgi:hypothetical protein
MMVARKCRRINRAYKFYSHKKIRTFLQRKSFCTMPEGSAATLHNIVICQCRRERPDASVGAGVMKEIVVMKKIIILATLAMLTAGQAMAQQAPNGNQTKTQDQVDQMHQGNGSLSGN